MAGTTFGELKRQLLLSLNRGDGKALLAVEVAINQAAIITALMFDPPELLVTGSVSVGAGLGEVEIGVADALPGLLDIIGFVSGASAAPMYFVPYELLDIVVPATAAELKYFSKIGNKLLVRKAPAAASSITGRYKKYPAPLASDSETLAFENRDSYLLSAALIIASTYLEEKKTPDLLKSLYDSLGVPFTVSQRAEGIIAGIPTLQEKKAELVPAMGG